MKTLYIAGPMSIRADSDWNYPAFFKAEEYWKEEGFNVLNPARNDADTSKRRSYYLRMAYPQVCQSDAIALLEDWNKSDGAVREVILAQSLGLDFYLQAGDEWMWFEITPDCLAEIFTAICKETQ